MDGLTATQIKKMDILLSSPHIFKPYEVRFYTYVQMSATSKPKPHKCQKCKGDIGVAEKKLGVLPVAAYPQAVAFGITNPLFTFHIGCLGIPDVFDMDKAENRKFFPIVEKHNPSAAIILKSKFGVSQYEDIRKKAIHKYKLTNPSKIETKPVNKTIRKKKSTPKNPLSRRLSKIYGN